MTRLILICGSLGANTLIKAGLADVALTLDRQLVWGVLPSEAERGPFSNG